MKNLKILAEQPVMEIRKVLSSKVASLGQPLTRHDCDEVLKDLALILPRACLSQADIDRMLDLYYGLLKEAGLTRMMLAGAAKAFVMAPRNGKSRFFPDPGELAEMCADGARTRRKALAAIEKAFGVLDHSPASDPEDGHASEEMVARLRNLGDQMRATRERAAVEDLPDIVPRRVNTARDHTDRNELLGALAKRGAVAC